jgi:hypothetical protein
MKATNAKRPNNWKAKKVVGGGPHGGSEAALGGPGGHHPARSEHGSHDGYAGIAELFVDVDLFCGDEHGLRDEYDQPTGKDDAVKDEERREMELGEPAVQEESAGEAGKDDRGGKNRDEEIEAAVAKTRG